MSRRIRRAIPAAALAAASVLCFAETTSTLSFTRIAPNGAFSRAVQSVRSGRERMDAISFVKIDAQGRVVVAGSALEPGSPRGDRDARPVVARFLANGKLDRTFSGNGIAPLGIALLPLRGYPTGFAIDRQGRLVVSGTFDDATGRVHLARLLANGAIDASFGTNGLARKVGASFFQLRLLQASPIDDSLLALDQFIGGEDTSVVHFTEAGEIDTDYGNGGIAKLETPSVQASDLAVDAQGGTIVAGRDGIVRFDAAGVRDVTFGSLGVLVGPNGGVVNAGSIEIDGQGRIVALGSDNGGSSRFFRFLPSGAPDLSFGKSVGSALGLPGNAEAQQFALGVAPGEVDRYVICSGLNFYAPNLSRQVAFGAFAQAIDPSSPNAVSAYVRRDPRTRAMPQTYLRDVAVSADARTAYVGGFLEVDSRTGYVARFSPVLMRIDLLRTAAARLPDLAIEWTSVPTTDETGAPTFDGTLRVTNTGRAASANARVEFYLSDDDVLDAGDRLLFSNPTGPLRARSVKTLRLESPDFDVLGARGKRLIAVLQALESDPAGRVAVSAPIE